MYKAFVVEDELVVRESVRENVRWEEASFTLCGEAADGEMALPLIEELRPDLVITDIRMPFMDGLELSRIVRKLLPATKIIILSGYEEFEYAQKAIGVQATDYLLKPVSSSDLFDVLLRIKDSLDAEEAERRKRSEEDELLRDSLMLTRERFMGDLSTGLLGSAAAIEYGKQLGLNLVRRYFCAVLVRLAVPETANTAARYAAYRKGEGVVREAVGEDSSEIAYRKSLSEMVVVVTGDHEAETDARCGQLSKTLKNELDRHELVGSSISVGSLEERVHLISVSLARAETAGRFRYIFGDASIIDYRDTERVRFRRAGGDAADARSLVDRLRFGDDDPAVLADEYLSVLREAVRSPAFFTHGFVDLVLELEAFVQELGGSPPEVFGETTSIERISDVGHDPAEQRAALVERIEAAVAFREHCRAHKYGDVILRAKDLIRRRYSDPEISLVEVASQVNISPSHFSTIFSQETGETFIHHLTDIRMTAAKRLLRTTADRSSEIAYAVGYKDPHYFSFAFKKHTGMTPSDYRQGG